MGTDFGKSQPQKVLRNEVKGIHTVFDGLTSPATYPSVSLCMIVKNEENNLAECLQSIGNFANEIIVVDTGSTDNTVEIARSFGAQVKYFIWVDDFADARNISIQSATGDWIFWMDADDRVSPENLNRLKQSLVSGLADVYMMRVFSRSKDANSVTEHLRLFKNGCGLRFERPLHETIMPEAIRQGLIIARTNIIIDHVGYEIQPEALKAKACRNLKIIQKCLVVEPKNLHWQYHLGVCYSVLEDYAQAAEMYSLVVQSPPKSLNWEVDVYQAYISLLSAYIKLNDVEAAEETLKRALSAFPMRRHLAITAGIFYLMKKEPEMAINFLEAAKELSQQSDWLGHVWSPGRLEAELGWAYLLAGKISQARTAYQAMLVQVEYKTIPDDVLQSVRVMFETGCYQGVVDLLVPVATGNPSGLRLLAQAESKKQHWEQAARHLGQAIILDQPKPFEWTKLAELSLRSGMWQSVEHFCGISLETEGESADTFNLLGLIAIQRDDIESAITYFIRALLNDFEYASTRNNLAQLAGNLNLSTDEIVRQHGLRLLRQGQAGLASETFAILTQLTPQDPEAYRMLAAALQVFGREQEALTAWQMAQQVIASV